MILELHHSLGDHVILSGLPEAYYKLFGEKTHIKSSRGDKYKYFFKNNPYVTDEQSGDFHSVSMSSTPKDYMIYYPVRVFYEITGHIVDPTFVQPNLYETRNPEPSTILINDQAGWPSRRGYPFLEDLCSELISKGYTVIYIRNSKFQDCFGKLSEKAIKSYTHYVNDFEFDDIVSYMRVATAYIGYDSGLSSIAGAMRVPYALLSGSVPAVNTKHESCFYSLDINSMCRKCLDTVCNCSQKSENKNGTIIERLLNVQGKTS